MPVSSHSQELLDQRCLAEYQCSHDEQLLDKLVERFEPLCNAAIRKTCRHYGVIGAEVEEVGGEARLGLLQALRSYDASQGKKLSTWCHLKAESYARNACERIQTRIKRLPMARFANDTDLSSHIDFVLSYQDEDDDHPEPTEWFHDHLLQEAISAKALSIQREEELRGKIKRLPLSLQPVAVLVLVEGKTQMEAASELNISQSYVCVRTKQAKDRLTTLPPLPKPRREEITLGDEATLIETQRRKWEYTQEKFRKENEESSRELERLDSEQCKRIEAEAQEQFYAQVVSKIGWYVPWNEYIQRYLQLLEAKGYFEGVRWTRKAAEKKVVLNLGSSPYRQLHQKVKPFINRFGHNL